MHMCMDAGATKVCLCVCARLCAGGEDDCFMVCVANSMDLETENLTLTMHASEHVPCQLVPKKVLPQCLNSSFFLRLDPDLFLNNYHDIPSEIYKPNFCFLYEITCHIARHNHCACPYQNLKLQIH